jgi:YbbR domain-containing protein
MKLSLSELAAFLKGAFLDNLGLKALSLAFAVGLFVYLQGQEDEQQRTVAAAVVLRLPPESAKRELMTPIPANVHVTLRGSARALDNLIQVGVPPVEIDLREAQLDTLVFEPSMFNVPRGIDIVIIDPPSIPLEWQEVVTRKIPVQASITGTPAEGFVVKGEPQAEPESIAANGPENLVEVMQFARLAPFDVSGLSEGSYRRRLAIDAPPARVSYIGPQSAAVTVTIARRVIEVRFARRRVEAVGVAKALLSPREVDVTIIGPPEVVRALRAEQIVPRADLSEVQGLNLEEMRHGSVKVKVKVDLANAEAEVQPPSVTVKW